MSNKHKNILFVCTGNTCRSPMAEAMFKGMTGETGEEIKISSAGTSAMPGFPAASEAVEVMRMKGLDLSKHRSRQTDENIIDSADIIYCMTKNHSDILKNRYPASSEKILVLKENEDIFDPIGEPLEVYRQCALIIEESLKKVFENLFKNKIK
ncbi:MAG: low molecular weight protein arginine phosphatase [Armatimonadota bacterium]